MEASSLTASERRQKLKAIIRVASGNFLEMYDFIVYGYYAVYIGKTFFPNSSEFASLMLSFGTFGAGYLMRPVGALVLGAYIDRHGRRKGLLLTLGLMAIGTLTIAVTPGYSVIGLAAPVIVVLGRLLQGLSAGVELGGVSIYLAEIATPNNRGFYCSWQSASQQVAVIFTAALGLGLTTVLSPSQMGEWGWRIPLLTGCLIIPLIFWLRGSLEETAAFKAQVERPRHASEVFRIVMRNWRIVLTGMLLTVVTTTLFYLITAYMPTFGKQALKLDVRDAFVVTLLVGVSNFTLLPFAGALSDRIGRHPSLFLVPVLSLLTAFPVLSWLAAEPSFAKLLVAGLWFSCIYSLYNGAVIPRLVEIMPREVRTAGFSLAYSLATAVFGGFTPAVCTYLIERTGNKAAPAYWMMFNAVVGLIGVFASLRLSRTRADREMAGARIP